MNSIFGIAFLIVMLYSIVIDCRYWRQRKASQKWIYVIFGSLSLFMFFSWMFGFNFYLPTTYFTRTLSPWVYSITHFE